MDKCKNCETLTVTDGYGEPIHEESGKYGCNPKARGAEAYPVATLG